MENVAPDIMVIDHGPVQSFRALPSGTRFLDHIGNLCIKIDELNGANSITFHPVSDQIPQACWLTDMAPVRPVRFA